MNGPREIILDDTLHIEGGSCCKLRACPRCRGRQHVQVVFGAEVVVCETCAGDSSLWWPAGSVLMLPCRGCGKAMHFHSSWIAHNNDVWHTTCVPETGVPA